MLDCFQKSVKCVATSSISLTLFQVPLTDINTIRAWCIINGYDCAMRQVPRDSVRDEYCILTIQYACINLSVFSVTYAID
jgi:uncharacterized membrane protein YpjA